MAKILILDDDPGKRGLLAEILQGGGHSIVDATDGGEALKLVSSQRPDLVMTDILMPTMDGCEFVRQLRSIPEIAATPVIFWTAAFRQHEAWNLARECGLDYAISNLSSAETVLETVDTCLQRAIPAVSAAEDIGIDRLRSALDELTRQTGELTAAKARLDALLQASLRLASQSDPETLLDEFCKTARNLTTAKFCMVGLSGKGTISQEQAYVAGLSREAHPGLNDVRRAHSVVEGLVSGRQAVRARNTSGNPVNFGFPPNFPSFNSLLAAPIAAATERFGWLCLFHRVGALEFTAEDARLAGILGELAGRLYANCRACASAEGQKMEALSQFAGGLAHDFNNVLNIVIGYSKMLMSKSDPSDPVYLRVEQIHKAGERAAALTQQLLAFSGKQMLQPRRANAADLLRDLEPALNGAGGDSIQIVTRIETGVAPVRIDVAEVRKAIVNVVANARDAMPGGGIITIAVANTELDEAAGRSYRLPKGRYALLTVTDTGSGISPQVKPRIFEPYYTTKAKGQGPGLGLATAYGVIRQSGGYICLESEPGSGTTCKMLLPQEWSEADIEPAIPGQRGRRGNETILVVEDEPSIRGLVEEILSSAGYNVLLAATGDKAIEIADEHEGEIHLLLTDVVLPGMGGKEIAARIALVRPETRILFMSGYTGSGVDERESLDPTAEFLQKPFTPDALCERIGGLLAAPSSIRRILVVDDDKDLRTMLAETLQSAGFEAYTAEDGRQARLQVSKGEIDLVITDLAMPGEEGMELIRALKRERPQLKIVAMSGAFGGEVLQAARALGANLSIAKPLSRETILQCIDQCTRS